MKEFGKEQNDKVCFKQWKIKHPVLYGFDNSFPIYAFTKVELKNNLLLPLISLSVWRKGGI